MKKIITWAIIILFYLSSAYGAWQAIRWDYLHRWKNLSPSMADVIIVVFPPINTAYCFVSLCERVIPPKTNGFFGIEERK